MPRHESFTDNKDSLEKVFYKSVRDIHPGEEMLLYAREAVYPEMELETLARHTNMAENQTSHSCQNCGEVFKSKVAVRRHQTYTCHATRNAFTSLKAEMGLQAAHMGGYPTVPGSYGNAGINNSMNMNSSGSVKSELSPNNNENSNNSNHFDSNGNNSDNCGSDDNSDIEAETGNGGEFKCDECPKSFQWKHNLQRHQLSHDANRKFPCENCDKVFTDPSNLQRHIRAQHVGARSHACSDCGKTFATSSGLKQHQHIHSSVKPFQCEVCLKAYTQFSNLCRHKRMHADCRQQIKCKDCGQAFSTVTSLSKHKRFCEGVMRSGMRAMYPGDKLSPLSLNTNGQALPPHLNPSLFPSIYAAAAGRHQFPFAPYPPFAAFPGMMPGGLPSMLGSSPHADALKMAANLQQMSSPDNKLHLSPDSIYSMAAKQALFSTPLQRSEPLLSPRHDDVHSDASDHSTKRSYASDEENADDLRQHSPVSSQLKRKLEEPLSSPRPGIMNAEALSKSPRLERRGTPERTTPVKEHSIAPPGFTQFRPQSPSISPRPGTKFTSTPKKDTPFDLSNYSNSRTEEKRSSSLSPVQKSQNVSEEKSSPRSGDDDAPLDLTCGSKKTISKPIAIHPIDMTRKTHIYGHDMSATSPSLSTSSSHSPHSPPTTLPSFNPLTSSFSVPTSQAAPIAPSPYTYPFNPSGFNPLMMESFLRMQEDKLKLQQEVAANVAAKFSNPFARFAMPGPTAFPGMHHAHPQYSMLRPDLQASMDKVMSPMMKMENPNHPAHPALPPHHAHHGHAHHAHHPNQFSAAGLPKSKERYSCKFCGKVFPRSANLTRHLRTHTGEQPYKCKYCERSFSISSNLQRHVRNIHNKEKPFKCQLCDRCFGQQTNLDRHLKKHEQEGPTVADSPGASSPGSSPTEGHGEAYFSEIRGFVSGVAKGDDDVVKGDVSDDEDEINVDEEEEEVLDEGEDDFVDEDDISDEDVLDEEESLAAARKLNFVDAPVVVDVMDAVCDKEVEKVTTEGETSEADVVGSEAVLKIEADELNVVSVGEEKKDSDA